MRKIGVQALDSKIGLKKTELQEKQSARTLIEQEIKEFSTQLEEKRKFQIEIDKTNILLSAKQETHSSLEREEAELFRLIKETEGLFDDKKYAELVQSIPAKKNELENLNSKNIEIMSAMNSLNYEMESSLQKKERIFKIEICPTCLQDVSESHKHNILNDTETKIARIKKSLSGLSEEKKAVSLSLTQIKHAIACMEDEKIALDIIKSKQEQLQRSKRKLEEIERLKQTIRDDQKLLLAHIEDLKQKIFSYSALELKHRKKDDELKNAIHEEREAEISLAETIRELELSHKEINLLEKFILGKEESKKKMQETNELIDWLNSQFSRLIEMIERNMLLQLRHDFSSVFRKWFITLLSDNSLDSQIDDNFTPVILQGETEMDYSFLSGGERTAVALAYRLALNQTINSALSMIKTKGLIILDEPTDGFSDAQINKIRDILDELNAEQLIIVSHEQKIESFVDNVLKVTKDAENSGVAQVSSSDWNQKT